MIRIENYQCDGTAPTKEEVRQCVEISTSSGCIVRLNWYFPYSGAYQLSVEPGMTYEECIEKLPKVYPV